MKDFLQVIFKTLNFLDDYTNEFCQQKKVCSAKKKKKKKIDLRLNNMRANYKNFNEEQWMVLHLKFEKFNKKPFWFL